MEHAILGAGPVGLSAMKALLGRDDGVRLISRRRPPGLPPAVVHLATDILDPLALKQACAGSDVVYQCLIEPADRWVASFPYLQLAAVAAAKAVGARLVSFENIDMYGEPNGEPLAEGHPDDPSSERGRVSARMAGDLRELHARRELSVAQVRASDLFGPGMRGSMLGDHLIGRAVDGKSPRGLGDLRAPHSWTYTGDAGETLARVGRSAQTSGRVWHVPSDLPRSQIEIASMLASLLGRHLRLQGAPTWMLRVVGLVQPEVRSLAEMAYQFERPLVLGDSAARQVLGQTQTPLPEALAQTVRWYAEQTTLKEKAARRRVVERLRI